MTQDTQTMEEDLNEARRLWNQTVQPGRGRGEPRRGASPQPGPSGEQTRRGRGIRGRGIRGRGKRGRKGY